MFVPHFFCTFILFVSDLISTSLCLYLTLFVPGFVCTLLGWCQDVLSRVVNRGRDFQVTMRTSPSCNISYQELIPKHRCAVTCGKRGRVYKDDRDEHLIPSGGLEPGSIFSLSVTISSEENFCCRRTAHPTFEAPPTSQRSPNLQRGQSETRYLCKRCKEQLLNMLALS